uniref:Sm domain-containing protein n=1 Tax=Ditylenchus dipsaci TaxID=166011 RepID=A0A915D8D0_9BILA
MEAEAECSEEKSPPAVYKWINQTLRVDLTDGRVIVGTLVCTDSQPNLILVNSQEYWTAGKSTSPRCVGMVMIASRHIQKICHVMANLSYKKGGGDAP